MTTPEPCRCHGCNLNFRSRNAVFKHLIDTDGACLNSKDLGDFQQYVLNQRRQKVILLYGYILDPDSGYKNGDDAAELVLSVLLELHPWETDRVDSRINRAYGNFSRGTDIVAQDEGTGAVTEVMTTRLPHITIPQQDWLAKVNELLQLKLENTQAEVRVLGRQVLASTAVKFNAEIDYSHRRIEYLLPVDFLFTGEEDIEQFFGKFPGFNDGAYCSKELADSQNNKVRKPDQETLSFMYHLKKLMHLLTTQVAAVDDNAPSSALGEEVWKQRRRNRDRRKVDERPYDNDSTDNQAPSELSRSELQGSNDTKRRPVSQGNQACGKRQANKKAKRGNKGKNQLIRKRYHNFTPTVMAHEYLAFRRLDRFYHRATLRLVSDENGVLSLRADQGEIGRPFLVLSLSADLFLTGQASRLVGLFLALARGSIDPEFVDCIFDDAYPHLVPTPPAPMCAMYAGEAFYTKWEGKLKSILTPRKANHLEVGWNDQATLDAVGCWQDRVREHAAQCWTKQGLQGNGILLAQAKWISEVLEPWAKRAKEQLADYRRWKATTASGPRRSVLPVTEGIEPAGEGSLSRAFLPPPSMVDASVPAMFEKVLHHLRHIDSNGLWPSTTAKRQLVMISSTLKEEGTHENEVKIDGAARNLSASQRRARTEDSSLSSAYAFSEGDGGASGSFTIGAMPGELCIQPKANTLFPELMKAAFELELALRPNREPSSTIAVNRNAQFRPHTDSGAGAGQETSLIVGLGTYSGGELVVEGEQKDIRYKATEFNGWKQRHWTMPFRGERFSLVWFTPVGCEGVHGIDLCK